MIWNSLNPFCSENPALKIEWICFIFVFWVCWLNSSLFCVLLAILIGPKSLFLIQIEYNSCTYSSAHTHLRNWNIFFSVLLIPDFHSNKLFTTPSNSQCCTVEVHRTKFNWKFYQNQYFLRTASRWALLRVFHGISSSRATHN